jgi:uncharacterized membrane protein
MLILQRCDYFDLGQSEKNSTKGFCNFFCGFTISRMFTLSRMMVFLSALTSLLLCTGFTYAQQGSGVPAQGRNQPRPNNALPPQMPQGDVKRMELEERRRLRQEIQRHGPDFRAKEAGARPLPNSLAAPVSQSAPSVPQAPIAPQSVPAPSLPPLPSYFGSPVLPAANPSPSNAAAQTSGISRGPALSQEERQQLRQQIRDERKRGLYPTPSEVDR